MGPRVSEATSDNFSDQRKRCVCFLLSLFLCYALKALFTLEILVNKTTQKKFVVFLKIVALFPFSRLLRHTGKNMSGVFYRAHLKGIIK